MSRERLEAARVEALFSLAWPAYFASLALACVLLIVLWERFPPPLLLGWLGAIAALTVARFRLQRAYRRAPAARSPRAWEGLFVLGAFGAGALWTFAPAVFLPESGPLLQLAVVFVVGGTIIGSAGIYAASPAAFYAFSGLPLAAVVAQMLALGGATYPLLALTVAVFAAAMVPVYRGIHANVIGALRTRIENEELTARLAQNEAKLRAAMDEAVGKVTELERTQAAYRELAAEEKMVFDTLPVGVAFFSKRVIVRCNRRLEQMLGYEPGELDGQSSRLLYPSEAVWAEAGERYKLLAGGEVMEGEFKLRRKDGRQLWCRSVGRAMSADSPSASTIVTYSDTSERHAAERALRKSESLYRNLVETSNDLIWSVDAAGRWSYLSPAATRRIYGCEPQDLLGREFRDLLAQEVAERDLAVFARILQGESVYDYQTRHRRRDGGHVDLSFNVVPLRDARGAVIGATGTARDVTAEKLAAAQQYENVEKLRLAVDAAQLTYWELERDSGAIYWGRDPGAPAGAGDARTGRWADFLASVHPEDRERYAASVEAAWEQAGAYSIEYRYVHADGRVAWMASHGRTAAQAGGRIHRMIGVTQEITERKRQEEEARFLAYHDTLTGLPNRRLLDDRLRQAVYVAQRRGGQVAVMVIDLDRFKQVNDALGHRAGDAVLREAAHRIAACVRKADTVARHGGDEFVVVIPDLAQEGDSQVVAEKILRALEPPFRVDGRDFSIGASIGISLCPNDAGDGDAALRNADAAMYRAKQLGRNNYRYFGR